MTEVLQEVLARIGPVDRQTYDRARAYHETLTKPPGSLGMLEEVACRLCSIQRRIPPRLEKAQIVVLAGDHGVAASEGVSPYPQEVTGQMVANFVRGGAAINAVCRSVEVGLRVIDIGVAHPVDLEAGATLEVRRIARGTRNIAVGPAMTESECSKALEVGLELAESCAAQGLDAVALGEMGIGNTTAASAVTAALLGRAVEEVTGRGSGSDDDALTRKVEVIQRALAVNQPDGRDALDVVRKVGGLEIAGLCGIALGLARHRIAIVSDGFISTAAVLLAVRLHPAVRDYVFCGHRSVEPGHRYLLEALGHEPLLDLGMRLGEGTGAALSLPILRTSVAVLRDMATFDGARISRRAP